MDSNKALEEIFRYQKASIHNQVAISNDLRRFMSEYQKKELSREEIGLISQNTAVVSMDIEVIKNRIQNIIDDIYDLQTEMEKSKKLVTNINISISDKFLITIFLISYFTFIFIITRN